MKKALFRRTPATGISPRRTLVVAVVAAAAMALMGGTASAAGAPQNANNCYGVAQSAFLAGPGGNPGTTNGAVTSPLAQQRSLTRGSMLKDFQQNARETNASCGTTGAP